MTKTARFLYWFFSAVVVVLAFRWVPFGVDWTIPNMSYHMESRKWLLYTHMVASAVPMAFVPFQISNKFRAKFPRLHINMGRAAIAGVFLGGFSLFALVPHMDIPIWGRAGFFISGLLWVMITATIIFGAVTQRLALPIWIGFGFPFKEAYSLSAWSAWSVNLTLFFAWQYRRKWLGALGFGSKPRSRAGSSSR
jgi:hypothetical protein